jgi:hypothetical protein
MTMTEFTILIPATADESAVLQETLREMGSLAAAPTSSGSRVQAPAVALTDTRGAHGPAELNSPHEG